MAGETGGERKLVIIWSSADREVALHTVLMYAKNALLKEWWDRVLLMAWGPSQRLMLDDSEVCAELEEARAAGVLVWACQACAERLGLAARLRARGLDVLAVGEPLSRMLQSGWVSLSF